MVLNYVPDNLNRIIRGYLKSKEEIPLFLVKLFSFQMIRAIGYIHACGVLHRDLKPQNILIDSATNKVFLCDFGSAKRIKSDDTSVAYICSRYYRAPELIFGSTEYGTSIDIWSFGCLIAEMVNGKPLFQGENTVDQLLKIFNVLDIPTMEQLSSLNKSSGLNYQFPTVERTPLKEALFL